MSNFAQSNVTMATSPTYRSIPNYLYTLMPIRPSGFYLQSFCSPLTYYTTVYPVRCLSLFLRRLLSSFFLPSSVFASKSWRMECVVNPPVMKRHLFFIFPLDCSLLHISTVCRNWAIWLTSFGTESPLRRSRTGTVILCREKMELKLNPKVSQWTW